MPAHHSASNNASGWKAEKALTRPLIVASTMAATPAASGFAGHASRTAAQRKPTDEAHESDAKQSQRYESVVPGKDPGHGRGKVVGVRALERKSLWVAGRRRPMSAGLLTGGSSRLIATVRGGRAPFGSISNESFPRTGGVPCCAICSAYATWYASVPGRKFGVVHGESDTDPEDQNDRERQQAAAQVGLERQRHIRSSPSRASGSSASTSATVNGSRIDAVLTRPATG